MFKQVRFWLLLVCIASGAIFLFSCGSNQEKVERIMEDGIEVVVNHLEPYQVRDFNTFSLDEIFSIDTEKSEITDLGITDIFGFEVTAEEEIFVLRTASGEGDFIYKFDRTGAFVKSFGPKGEGPGEFQNPHHIALDSEENIVIIDIGKTPLLKYDKEGVFIDDYQMQRGDMIITSGPRTNSLVLGNSFEAETRKQLFDLKLLNSDLELLKIIDGFSFEMNFEKFRAIPPLFCWSSSNENIFVAKEERGYEIWVYDFEGKLIRKIRKDFTQIPISEDYKKKALDPFPENVRSRAYFPEFHPPFQSLVAGADGKLLVPTFEEGTVPREFMFDIFTKDGVFIGRKSLNIWIWEGHLWARLNADKFYCLLEKESGYKELVKYQIDWQ